MWMQATITIMTCCCLWHGCNVYIVNNASYIISSLAKIRWLMRKDANNVVFSYVIII